MEELNRPLELAVIGIYMLFLLGIGMAFRRFNANISDFFRTGARGTWWLVGASAFMAGISAYTFTGASGVAYQAGWSVAIIYIGNAAGFLVNFLFLAPWFRQLRAITPPEVIRLRFGHITQQFYAYLGVMMAVLVASLQLWALAIFSASVFGFEVWHVIVVVGLVVLFYSTTGGSWAVMATDFVQSLIMVPMTILITVLCLIEVGGVTGFTSAIRDQGLASDFAIINAPDFAEMHQFTWAWAIAMFLKQTIEHNTLNHAQRYFAVKDGREARRAAGLAFLLMSLGCVFWFIPPMTARLLFSEQVEGMTQLSDPAESAFAVASINLLPVGLTGMIVVAMFAATMSSMDSGINRNAAIFVRDIYPTICRLLGVRTLSDKGLLVLSRVFSIIFGGTIIGIATYFANVEGRGMFDVMLDVGAMLGVPLAVPLFMGLFVRHVPFWSAMFAVLCSFGGSLAAVFAEETWTFQEKTFVNFSIGIVAFLITIPFWRKASSAYREQVDEFFTRMHKPVNFGEEVGKGNDPRQLMLVGGFTVAVGLFINSLMLLPNPWEGRLAILFVGGVVVVIGAVMFIAGRIQRDRVEFEQTRGGTGEAELPPEERDS